MFYAVQVSGTKQICYRNARQISIVTAGTENLGRVSRESVAPLLVARRTNNRKVVGSMPANVVCITVLTGNRLV